MKKEILSEMVTLRQIFEGRYVKYVEQYCVEGCFVIFNNEGNKRFAKLKRLIEEYTNKTIKDVILKDETLIDSQKSIFISCILNNDKKAIQRNSEGFWMIHQVFIDYAYSLIYSIYRGEIENELMVLHEKGQLFKSENEFDKFYLYKNGNIENGRNLTEIFDRNKDKPGFDYLLSKLITKYTRDDGMQMFSYQKSANQDSDVLED